jgi:subtilisin family serine protease
MVMLNRRLTRTVLALVLGAAVSVGVFATGSVRPAYATVVARRAPSSVIVAAKNASAMPALRRQLERGGARIARTLRWNAYLVTPPSGTRIADFSATAGRLSDARYAQVNGIVHAVATANDPYFALQWGLPDVGAPSAWDTSLGSGVSVAVIDTGIDASHPDLAGQVVLFKNYVTIGAAASDDNGHGTHVAGIIGAVRNNGLDGVGVAPGAKLYALKVLDANGDGFDADVAQAIRDAVDFTPCSIISMSLGATGSASPALSDAVAYAEAHDRLVVAAAGNAGTNEAFYPAALPGVLGVGAVDENNNLASFSNFGPVDEDVVAPGQDIWSTWVGGGMAQESGTSMATPFVSGCAALVWSAHPALTATQVVDVLERTARDLGVPGVDNTFGHGLVRADYALTAFSVPDTTAPVTISDARSLYYGSATIHLAATDNPGGSGVAHTYYVIDAGARVEGTTALISGIGAHELHYWSVDASGNVEPTNTASFSIARQPTTLTIGSSTRSTVRTHTLSLAGVLTPGRIADPIRVYVLKPGARAYGWLPLRGTYGLNGRGGALWSVRYTPLMRGTYRFKARYLGDASRAGTTSSVVSVVVR